jgi:hypothetical protein
VTRVILHGELPAGATGKDVILALCGLFNKDEVCCCCWTAPARGPTFARARARSSTTRSSSPGRALRGACIAEPGGRARLADRSAIRSLSVDERLTIANMTTEWGALTGLFPVDEVLLGWLRSRSGTTVAVSVRLSLYSQPLAPAEQLQKRGPADVASDPFVETAHSYRWKAHRGAKRLRHTGAHRAATRG